MAFGDRLLELLEENELSQKQFSKLLNIAPSTLNGYIKNKREPDYKLLKGIALSLNVSTDYLLELKANDLALTAGERQLIGKLRRLDEKQRAVICKLIELCFTDKKADK